MKLVMEIDGPSAEDLFLVGPIDLKEHFLKEHLHVDPRDVKKCFFEEVDDPIARITGKTYNVITHKDNFDRDEQVFV